MNSKKTYKGIIAMVIGFSILSWIFTFMPFLYFAIAVGFLASISDRLASFIYKYWMKLAELLGFINSRIILFILFFVFLTPLALLRTLFTGDQMNLKDRGDRTTTFLNTEKDYSKTDFEKPW